AYIRHLIKCDETFGIRLTSYHNLYFLLDLMKNVRQAIMDDNLLEFRQAFFEEYGFNKANSKSFYKLEEKTSSSSIFLIQLVV
ncbi:tRNA-guanine transglycosylase, partial [Enterococcus faecium]|uniref:tRNA-guanine transglycosylase n=1 Tax=Enterococcus faecium TaxID=1352 RepID=UPI0030C85A83